MNTRPPIHVVPANAGTHNHRWSWVGALFPHMAEGFRITSTEAMGPGVRRDDEWSVL
jgi:hypothetical protein